MVALDGQLGRARAHGLPAVRLHQDAADLVDAEHAHSHVGEVDGAGLVSAGEDRRVNRGDRERWGDRGGVVAGGEPQLNASVEHASDAPPPPQKKSAALNVSDMNWCARGRWR